jgi:Glucose / Sorbosone dehydrogenase
MQRVRPLQSFAGFCLLSISLVSCQAPPVALISEPLSTPNVKLTKLTEGFNFSVKMTLLPDGSFLVIEKNTGFVRRVSPAFQLQPEPVVDIAVNRASERGLLGIAAHPDFNRISQLKGNPRGKILRYNDDGSIPADTTKRPSIRSSSRSDLSVWLLWPSRQLRGTILHFASYVSSLGKWGCIDSETLLASSARMPFLPGFDEAQGRYPGKADGK